MTLKLGRLFKCCYVVSSTIVVGNRVRNAALDHLLQLLAVEQCPSLLQLLLGQVLLEDLLQALKLTGHLGGKFRMQKFATTKMRVPAKRANFSGRGKRN